MHQEDKGIMETRITQLSQFYFTITLNFVFGGGTIWVFVSIAISI